MRILTLSGKRLVRLMKNKGRMVSELEKAANVTVKIVPETKADRSVQIDGTPEGEWVSEQVLRAVDLGFDPKDAFRLLKDDVYLEQVDLEQSMHGKSRAVERQKARIIGTEGKAKRALEDLSEAKLAVSDGPMLGILGGFDEATAAKEAVLQLLEGRPHSGVFAYLEDQKRRREARRLGAHV